MSKKIEFTRDDAYHKWMMEEVVNKPVGLPYINGFDAGIAYARIKIWGEMNQQIDEARAKYGIHNLSKVALRRIVLGGE